MSVAELGQIGDVRYIVSSDVLLTPEDAGWLGDRFRQWVKDGGDWPIVLGSSAHLLALRGDRWVYLCHPDTRHPAPEL
jgi:hypothetical protein